MGEAAKAHQEVPVEVWGPRFLFSGGSQGQGGGLHRSPQGTELTVVGRPRVHQSAGQREGGWAEPHQADRGIG